MRPVFSVLLVRAALWLLQSHRRASLDLLGIRAAGWYVRGVGAARELFVGLLALAGGLALAAAGFVFVHVGLYVLLPAPANALLLLALGVVYLLAALLLLRRVCDEKTWLAHSRADRCVRRALSQAKRRP